MGGGGLVDDEGSAVRCPAGGPASAPAAIDAAAAFCAAHFGAPAGFAPGHVPMFFGAETFDGRDGISSNHAPPSLGRFGSVAPEFALPTGVEERHSPVPEPFPLEALASVDAALADRERLRSSFVEGDAEQAVLHVLIGTLAFSRFQAFSPCM